MTVDKEIPFLIQPPEPGKIMAILALDVDGVLNKLGRQGSAPLPEAESGGRKFGIDLVDYAVLDALDKALACPGVALAWTTTWGSDVANLRQLLGGRLAGGFVAAERPAGVYVDFGWKEKAVVHLVRRYGARVAWVDDEAVANSLRWGNLPPELAGDRALLVAPEPGAGLSLADAERVAVFLAGMEPEPRAEPRIGGGSTIGCGS